METVRHTEEVLRVVEETDFVDRRQVMMDKGVDVPAQLHENYARLD